MDRSLISEIAENLIVAYRDILYIDPFYKIKVEIIVGEFISKCEVEVSSAASWILKLNPDRHIDLLDIKQSVLDCLIKIIFRYVDPSTALEEAHSRITAALTAVLPDLSDEADEEVSDGI